MLGSPVVVVVSLLSDERRPQCCMFLLVCSLLLLFVVVNTSFKSLKSVISAYTHWRGEGTSYSVEFHSFLFQGPVALHTMSTIQCMRITSVWCVFVWPRKCWSYGHISQQSCEHYNVNHDEIVAGKYCYIGSSQLSISGNLILVV